mgnify:CR=1 FL=1
MSLDSRMLIHILDECETSRIKYCVLRNYEEIPNNIGHDVDILVAAKDYLALVEIIGGTRGKFAVSIKKIWDKDGFYTYILYSFEEGEMCQLKLDIWIDLRWRGISWIDTDYILENREKCGITYRPSPGCEAAVSMLKELVGGGDIPEKYYSKICNGIMNDEEKFMSALKPIWDEYVVFFANSIKNHEWEKIDNSKKKLRRYLLTYSFKNYMILRHFKQNIVTMYRKFSAIVYPTGKLVVIIGPDGSGKTTVIDGVKSDLKLLFPQISTYHTRLQIFPELRSGLGLSDLKKRNNKDEEGKANTKKEGNSTEQEQSRISKIVSIVVLIYYTLEFVVGRPLIRNQKREGFLIIFDRYYYDFFSQPYTRNLIWNYRKFLCKLVPTPDYIFHLYADGKTVFERKGELNIEEIDLQNAILERLLCTEDKYYKLDTKQYNQQECIQIIEKIIIKGSIGEI